MKDEIKEILNKLIKASCANGVFLTTNTRDKIIDYITTLQEENETLKTRIDKTIEYINHAQNYGTMAQVMPHLKPYVNGDDLLNILQGDDNNAKD